MPEVAFPIVAKPFGGATIARIVDDYIEEVAVGTPWWVLVLAFGLGMPVLLAVVSLMFRIGYQPGVYSIALMAGALFGVALRLIARERERYRALTFQSAGDLKALRALRWPDFEIAVGELVRRQGYLVKERGGFQADGGVDLIAEGQKGRRIAVQCKQWKSWRVREAQVRELYGTVKGGGFSAGWLVTCGVFTDSARSWAVGKELRLIDGRELESVVKEGASLDPTLIKADGPPPADPEGLECPNCGAELRRRTNTKDRSEFWGCTNQTCGWTFNDAPHVTGEVLCDRGHQMVERTTKRGVLFWGCSHYPTCLRKRLFVRKPEPARDS
jgi:restriction system protein